MNTKLTIKAVVIVLAFVVAAAIIAYPAFEAHAARSLTADLRDKGQQGDFSSGGNRQGKGPCTICT
jgi:hypothetical protein